MTWGTLPSMGKKNPRKKKINKYDKWEIEYTKRVNALAGHAWYALDTTIASLVSKSCDRYIAERHGIMFAGLPYGIVDDELADKCTGYAYEVLKELADAYATEMDDHSAMEFPAALAEMMQLGYLWD